MKFDPGTKELFTDDGELVKVLRCPLRMRWEQLAARDDSPHRTCAECAHPVLDTAALSDAEVLAAVRTDPSTCLCVRASQENLSLLPTKHNEAGAAVDRVRKAGTGPLSLVIRVWDAMVPSTR